MTPRDLICRVLNIAEIPQREPDFPGLPKRTEFFELATRVELKVVRQGVSRPWVVGQTLLLPDTYPVEHCEQRIAEKVAGDVKTIAVFDPDCGKVVGLPFEHTVFHLYVAQDDLLEWRGKVDFRTFASLFSAPVKIFEAVLGA